MPHILASHQFPPLPLVEISLIELTLQMSFCDKVNDQTRTLKMNLFLCTFFPIFE